MLTHPTTDRLRTLGLAGMARVLEEQRRQLDAGVLSFEDRLAMWVDRLVHGAHRLQLKGESMGRLCAAQAKLDEATAQ